MTPGDVLSFSCVLCSSSCFNSEKLYFEHIGSHLRTFEVGACVFKDCNLYATFATHRNRKHKPHNLEVFEVEVLKTYTVPAVDRDDSVFGENEKEAEPPFEEYEDLSQIIKGKFGHLFLKLESTFNVPNKCIDEIIEELQFICCSASGPLIRDVESTLKQHKETLYCCCTKRVHT